MVCPKKKVLEVCKGDDCVLRAMIETFTKKGETSLYLPKTNTVMMLFCFYVELWGHMGI